MYLLSSTCTLGCFICPRYLDIIPIAQSSGWLPLASCGLLTLSALPYLSWKPSKGAGFGFPSLLCMICAVPAAWDCLSCISCHGCTWPPITRRTSGFGSLLFGSYTALLHFLKPRCPHPVLLGITRIIMGSSRRTFRGYCLWNAFSIAALFSWHYCWQLLYLLMDRILFSVTLTLQHLLREPAANVWHMSGWKKPWQHTEGRVLNIVLALGGQESEVASEGLRNNLSQRHLASGDFFGNLWHPQLWKNTDICLGLSWSSVCVSVSPCCSLL